MREREARIALRDATERLHRAACALEAAELDGGRYSNARLVLLQAAREYAKASKAHEDAARTEDAEADIPW